MGGSCARDSIIQTRVAISLLPLSHDDEYIYSSTLLCHATRWFLSSACLCIHRPIQISSRKRYQHTPLSCWRIYDSRLGLRVVIDSIHGRRKNDGGKKNEKKIREGSKASSFSRDLWAAASAFARYRKRGEGKKTPQNHLLALPPSRWWWWWLKLTEAASFSPSHLNHTWLQVPRFSGSDWFSP